MAVPHEDIPVGEQVEVVLGVAGEEQFQSFAVELVLGLALEALNLLEQGPNMTFPHALVIVRAALLDDAKTRFPLWGEPTLIYPDCESANQVLTAFVD